MDGYLLIIAATVLLALSFAISKKYQLSVGDSATAGLFFNAANGFFTAVVFLAICGFKVLLTPFSAAMAVLLSVFAAAYVLLGFKVMKSGGVSIYTMFLMSGGMILPYVYGLLRLGEDFSFLRLIGLILILAATVITNTDDKMGRRSLIPLLILIFVLNGLVSIVSKVHQTAGTYETVSAEQFVMWSGVAKLAVCAVSLIFIKKNDAPRGIKLIHALPLIAASAVIGGVSYLLQLIGAESVPASVLYPCVTGGSIIFSAIADIIFFRSFPTLRQWIAIAVCFIGTCLFI